MTTDNQVKLSVVIIAKNAGDDFRHTLQSVQWADEIVVVDSGSSDQTVELAESFGAKVIVNRDWPGFGPQRQLAQQHASGEWVFWIDTDEVVSDELRESIQQVIAQPTGNTVYSVPRLSWVFGRYIRHCGWYPDRVLRLYPRELTQYNDALVHEKVDVTGDMQVAPINGDLLHYTYRDLNHYLVKSAGYAEAWAEQRQAKGKTGSIAQGVGHAIGCFVKMYLLKAGFLDGRQGFLLSVLSAHSTFVKYADLWIRTTTESPKR